MKAEDGRKLGFSRLWLICGLFFNHSGFVTINILIKALQILVQVAHMIFIFMEPRKDICRSTFNIEVQRNVDWVNKEWSSQ